MQDKCIESFRIMLQVNDWSGDLAQTVWLKRGHFRKGA